MAITRIKGKQLEGSTAPGALLASDTSNNFVVKNPTTGADTIWFYDDSVTALGQLTIGTNLSITGTTLNASAGAGGYAEVQEEGGALTARTKINFIGSGFTAADDAGNTRTNVTLATFLNTLATQGNVNAATQLTGITPVANGGTGLSTGTSGGILFYSAAGTLASSGALTDNVIVVGGGAGVTPNSIAAGLGTTTTVLHGNAGGEPTWGAVSLTADVTGTLPAVNGGTGQASYAVGDLLSANTTTTLSRVAAVASGSVLKSAGVSTLPVWGTLASTDLSNSANIALLNGNQTFTGTNTFSNNITINGTPSASTDAATVGYVTTVVAGLRKGSVRAATTTAGTLASSFENGDTIDGVVLATGNLILIKDQAAPAENGVYTVNASGAPTRATWMDAANEIDGVYVAVEDGTTLAGTLWITVSEVTTLNTDAITFTQIQTSGSIGGSVAANKVAYGSGVNTLTTTTNFHFNGTQLAIGTASPAASTVLTTKGTGTSTITYGFKHFDSADTLAFTIADNGSFSFGTSNVVNVSNSSYNPSTNYSVALNALSWSFNSLAAGSILSINAGTATATELFRVGGATASTSTSAEILGINNNYSHTVASGSNNFTAYKFAGTLNQTGTYTGVSRGLWITPTLTSVAGGFVGVEITATGQTALKTTAGFVSFTLGSDANYDMFTRSSAGNLERIANGTTGQFLGANTGAAPTWQTPAGGTITRAYLTGSTSSVIDLDSGTAVTDIDGGNIAFTVPADLEKTFVVRNGVMLSRSGTVSRDYTLVSATGVLTLASALTADESLMVYKIV